MKKESKITIILVTRNSKSVLFNCLKSLDNNDILSSYKNAEWIIVDNASSDGSIEEVNKIYLMSQL
jgi:glycosyltransferase involved in cell wall biosynthesis